MNNESFLTEVRQFIDDTYHEFEAYQRITRELLLAFHKLSEENGITYTLAFGSLIGAIRDKGHIPWDYDIDVVIPYYEKEKLIACLETQLDSEYYYTYINNTNHYPTSCVRICKKGYSFTAVHVDVFFLISCPNDPLLRERFIKRLNRTSYLRGVKYSPYWFPRELGGGLFQRVINKIDRIRSRLIPKSLIALENRIAEKNAFGTTDYCYVVGDLRYKKSHRYEWFRERVKVPVDGDMLYVPSGYDDLLKNIYGDYTKYMKIQSRFEEFYDSLNTIKKRNKAFSDGH